MALALLFALALAVQDQPTTTPPLGQPAVPATPDAPKADSLKTDMPSAEAAPPETAPAETAPVETAKSEAPKGDAAAGEKTPTREDMEDAIPDGAPKDDYGFVAWCHGALAGQIELDPIVEKDMDAIEGKAKAAKRRADDAEIAKEHKKYLVLYEQALLAAEKASPTAIHQDGVDAELIGYKIWGPTRNKEPVWRMVDWGNWEVPPRCEKAAKRLYDRASLLGVALKTEDQPAPTPAPTPAASPDAPSLSTPAASRDAPTLDAPLGDAPLSTKAGPALDNAQPEPAKDGAPPPAAAPGPAVDQPDAGKAAMPEAEAKPTDDSLRGPK